MGEVLVSVYDRLEERTQQQPRNNYNPWVLSCVGMYATLPAVPIYKENYISRGRHL